MIKENYSKNYIITSTTTEYGGNIAKESGSDKVIQKAKKQICNINIFWRFFSFQGMR